MAYQRTHASRLGAVALVVALGLAGLAGCADGPPDKESGYPTKNVPTSRSAWVAKLCAYTSKARTELRDVFDGVGKDADLDTADGRAAVQEELADRLAATAEQVQALDHRLADAGIPKTPTGSDLAGQARNGYASTLTRVSGVEAAVRRVPTVERGSFERELRAALGPMEGGVLLLDDLFRSLRLNPDFAEDLAATKACDDL